MTLTKRKAETCVPYSQLLLYACCLTEISDDTPQSVAVCHCDIVQFSATFEQKLLKAYQLIKNGKISGLLIKRSRSHMYA